MLSFFFVLKRLTLVVAFLLEKTHKSQGAKGSRNDGCYAAPGENAFPLYFESDIALTDSPCITSAVSYYPDVMQRWSNSPWNLYDKFSIYYPTQLAARLMIRVYYELLIRLFDRAPMSWQCKEMPSARTIWLFFA